jgi:MEDS: MEthanogen/methylotroph, DcmR Sensory domain
MLTHTFSGITGTTLEIIERLNKIEYGEHAILIYPNQYSFREIYSHYCNIALKNNEIVLILTYYETADCVRQTLKEIDIDVEKYEKEKVLMIKEDNTKTYFDSANDFLSFIKVLDKQNEMMNKNGISVIADMGTFHFQNNKDAVMTFESSLPSKFGIKMKRICNYHDGDLGRFEDDEMDSLIEPHHLQIKVLPIIGTEIN